MCLPQGLFHNDFTAVCAYHRACFTVVSLLCVSTTGPARFTVISVLCLPQGLFHSDFTAVCVYHRVCFTVNSALCLPQGRLHSDFTTVCLPQGLLHSDFTAVCLPLGLLHSDFTDVCLLLHTDFSAVCLAQQPASVTVISVVSQACFKATSVEVLCVLLVHLSSSLSKEQKDTTTHRVSAQRVSSRLNVNIISVKSASCVSFQCFTC